MFPLLLAVDDPENSESFEWRDVVRRHDQNADSVG